MESDDYPYVKRLDPELDYDAWDRPESNRRLAVARARESQNQVPWQPRHNLPVSSGLAVDAMHLAMEFGLDMGRYLFDDDPIELTCDSSGHIDMPDRWDVYYRD
jgi:hypothetical protein